MIGAAVHVRRQERRQDEAEGTVKFDAVEAGPLGPFGCCDEVVAELFYFREGERPGTGALVVGGPSEGPGSDEVLTGECAGVVQLDRCKCSLAVSNFCHGRESGDVVLVVDAQLACERLAVFLHVRGAGGEHGVPAGGELLEPVEIMLRGSPVLVALLVC